MKTLTFILLMSLFAASAIAGELRPVKHTTKGPYQASKQYCNGGGSSGDKNIACYNHDACYADPRGKSRLDCDKRFLKQMTKASNAVTAGLLYLAVRAGGWTSWNRSRDKDERE